ncbi:hypothetical protein C7408_11652 [Paraburkholderia caballeronis]|nr:hypothetical protein C7408_11652 [Paraburkholderia caballeronis]TDV12291.1 hypothetical protein C7406_11752 [Paraburkholderia caballeronis]TDV22764.1 hypothetical protein C7404_11652 [Paraburkholderia caballeronis]
MSDSDRTLARKVRALTGDGVGECARKIKLDQVSERLITTSAPASAISAELVFGCVHGSNRHGPFQRAPIIIGMAARTISTAVGA